MHYFFELESRFENLIGCTSKTFLPASMRRGGSIIQGHRVFVQGVRTPALLIRVPFLKLKVSINITGNA